VLGAAHVLSKGYEWMTQYKNNLKDYVRMKQFLKDLRDQQAELAHQNVIRAQDAELNRLRTERDAVWNDFQAKQQSKAIYRELEAYDKKLPTLTTIDPTEKLAQNEKQISDSRSWRSRACIKPAAWVFEPGRDDLWDSDIISYILGVRELDGDLPNSPISDADYMALWQSAIEQEQRSRSPMDEAEEMEILERIIDQDEL
jgi:hypothetical protein